MAYDEAGNQGPDGIGMYADRATGLEAGRMHSLEMQASAVAAYERAASEPTSLSGLVMLGVLGVAIVGNSIATTLHISFDNAIWLMIGLLVAVGVVARLVVKRREANDARRERESLVQSLGFSTPEAYDRAVEDRRSRLGFELYEQLVHETFSDNLRATGRPDVGSLVEFEAALARTAQQRGFDAALRGHDFEPPRPSLRRMLAERLKGARWRLLLRTTLLFAVLAFGSGSLFVALGLVESAVGVLLTAPLWGMWGALGATLALTNEVASLVLGAFDGVVGMVQQTAAAGVYAAALKLTGSPAGIRLSALPEVFQRWRRETLGDTGGSGYLARLAGWIGNWLLEGVQKRALRHLGRDAQRSGVAEISLVTLANAVPAVATAALTGPLRRYIVFTRWLTGTGMFGSLVLTALGLFGASLLRR